MGEFPEALKDAPWRHKAVWLFMRGCQGSNGMMWWSRRQIADRLGITETQLSQSIKYLAELGLLAHKKGPDGQKAYTLFIQSGYSDLSKVDMEKYPNPIKKISKVDKKNIQSGYHNIKEDKGSITSSVSAAAPPNPAFLDRPSGDVYDHPAVLACDRIRNRSHRPGPMAPFYAERIAKAITPALQAEWEAYCLTAAQTYSHRPIDPARTLDYFTADRARSAESSPTTASPTTPHGFDKSLKLRDE
jgi:hypothetical protein